MCGRDKIQACAHPHKNTNFYLCMPCCLVMALAAFINKEICPIAKFENNLRELFKNNYGSVILVLKFYFIKKKPCLESDPETRAHINAIKTKVPGVWV